MPPISKRVAGRLREAHKTFRPILIAQRDRDVSEADTVTVVKDLLSDMFGYDKYAEVTSEHAPDDTTYETAKLASLIVGRYTLTAKCAECARVGH